MTRDIAAILFDKDGTLFDFDTTWDAWAHAFLLRLCTGDRARAKSAGLAIGYDLDARRFSSDSAVIAGTPEELVADLMPLFPDYDKAALFDLLNTEAAAAPMAEAVPLAPFLDGLRARGLRLGVATNDAEAPARAHLAASGVLERFDFIAGSDSGHGAKPGPGQLLAFCQALDVAPDRAVMGGDSLHDLAAGRAAGMSVVGVLTGYADRSTLAPHADAVLDNIGHLPRWLDTPALA